MQFKEPKNTDKISWTKHSIQKMKYYGLSAQRLKRILRHPQRTEKGIAPNTIAIMQPTTSKKQEIWLMYQITGNNNKINNKNKLKIISAWRYPGRTKAGESVPIPKEIAKELNINITHNP